MESDEDDEETQASFCRFLDDNFKLLISVYAPSCEPKVKIKKRLAKASSTRLNINLYPSCDGKNAKWDVKNADF